MRDRESPSAFAVTLRFHGDLPLFLKRSESRGHVNRPLREKTSVKDVIEACGVPHPEVDLILSDGVSVGFAHQLLSDATLDVYPVATPLDLRGEDRLQRRQLTRFVVDGHLGKLARDLRLLGIDTAYRNDATDGCLLRITIDEERALLTRDRRLLMHAVVRDGYCPRSDGVEEQIVEVVRRFELRDALQPYTRCLLCNGGLETATKGAVIDRLEPLTKIYYNDFRRCTMCSHIYWSGSHFGKLEARLERIRAAIEPQDGGAATRKWA